MLGFACHTLSEREAKLAMLLELRAENYAVIDRAGATFNAGLNLMTGETGAGKSILIDALALLLGGKASADYVRHGADRAVVSCAFESTPGAEAVLADNGISVEPGEDILLRREIQAGGKGRAFINNQPATVAVLRALAPELALVHAQGETLGAFDDAQQRSLLDRYAGLSTGAVAEAFAAWRQVNERLAALETDEQDRLRMADIWRFQRDEIEAAAITGSDEDTALEAEKRVLANAERLYAAAMGTHALLYEDEHAAAGTLGKALRLLEDLARFDDRFTTPAAELAAARATVEDIAERARDFAEKVQAGPERLAEVEDRLAALDRLKRKYGGTLAAVLATAADNAQRLTELENRDSTLAELRAQQSAASSAYEAAASALTAARRTAADKLARAAEREINDLAMQVRFAVEVTPRTEPARWAAHGRDTVACLIATNAGEPLKPLEEIASGGEMSRVLLALKVTVEDAVSRAGGRRRQTLPRTLVFDEIDIGIGGRAAEAVGLKLKALSRTQQVLCITHLPQIAAFADQHYLIEKRTAEGRTQTSIRQMEDPERVREIARMLSGATVTETSLRHAENLLTSSR